MAIVFFIMMHAGRPANAQDLTPSRFSTLSSLRCVFAIGAAGAWEDGTATARLRSEVLVRVSVDGIDDQDGTATIRDVPEAASHAVAQFSGWTLHILQTDGTGGFNVTSVFARNSRAGRLKAVHSRASYLPSGATSDPNVQQLYGDCEPGFRPQGQD